MPRKRETLIERLKIKPAFGIRPAAARDAAALAHLATQLGYPSSQADIEGRLEPILRDEDHAVFVAELGSRVVGWVHAYLCRLVESEPTVEIGGLIVEEDHRNLGAGRSLMRHAEEWARQKGCRVVRLRSNIIRKDAHRFYEELGYKNIKTQHTFRKTL